MDAKAVKRVTSQVSRQFPELKGARPGVKRRRGGEQFELTYKAAVKLPGGRKMTRVVRVVATADGRVVRMSTSK
jgi:hypothetical protein